MPAQQTFRTIDVCIKPARFRTLGGGPIAAGQDSAASVRAFGFAAGPESIEHNQRALRNRLHDHVRRLSVRFDCTELFDVSADLDDVAPYSLVHVGLKVGDSGRAAPECEVRFFDREAELRYQLGLRVEQAEWEPHRTLSFAIDLISDMILLGAETGGLGDPIEGRGARWIDGTSLREEAGPEEA
jgi:hypothetical protein